MRSMYRQLYPGSQPSSSPLRRNNVLSGGASLEFAVSKKPLNEEYSEQNPSAEAARKQQLSKPTMSGFNTAFYQRRDTLSFYQPAHGTANTADTVAKIQQQKGSNSMMQEMQPWATAGRTSLLQNTPISVDMHKTSFLNSKRVLKNISSPGTMLPTQKMSPVGELSRSQIMGISSPQTSRQHVPGFSPSHRSKQFLEPEESRLISQRIENYRPKPRFIYKAIESSDEEENE